ncbi:MAG: hypothetical protein M3Z11_11970 [Candidatus Dormibacteraeota bacterium]|nr:hypothetical protein [Candidatus Dormibacteraeota bacterium]
MNEAGLISAAPGAAPEVEAIAAKSRIASSLQAAAVIVAALAAFWPSLLGLETGFPMHRPLGAIAFVPLISLALAALIAIRPQPPGPDIHDRYLDYILGVVMLGTAAAMLALLPSSLSIFFWSWRLDMLALPLFLAGALALLCGSRVLWRYLLPIAVLLLAWPLPYAALGLTGRFFSAQPVVIALIGLVAILALIRSRRSRLPRTAVPGARHGGGLVAGALLLLATALTLSADWQIGNAAQLLRADGQPALGVASKPPASIAGSPRTDAVSPAGPVWGGNQVTYQYGSSPAILVSALTPPDARDLDLAPAAVVEGQGYRTTSTQSADLGAAVTGHVERYAAATGPAVTVVWWDWPVQAPAGARRQRVIVEGISRSADQLLAFARNLVASEARSMAP